MRCFSLIARDFVASPSEVGLQASAFGYYRIDAYPKSTEGIELHPTDRTVRVGFAQKVPASEELLKLSPESGAIRRGDRDVTILRASIDMSSGNPILVPERDDDKDNALVYLDVGPGHSTHIRYLVEPPALVAHSRADGDTGHERVLVIMKPFEPVVANRSMKRWLFFGAERLREVLRIAFDGRNIFYDTRKTEA
jgi:hypothetical protein